MAKPEIEPNLPTVDELFTTQAERDDMQREKVQDIDLTEIDPFPNHPFQVRDDEEMLSLAQSIKERGVLSPAIARLKGERAELVSGHRRMRASELAGLETMPTIIRKLTDEEATIIMCDSNVQREKILPSEKAFAYKMKLDALKQQGKRTDLTSAPLEPKWRANAKVASDVNDSVAQIKRYIRLTELIAPLLQMVDEGKIAFRPAVELSYLPKNNQKVALSAMEKEVCTPSLAQAIKMKQFHKEGKLTPEVIQSIMMESKPNQKEVLKIPTERIAGYFKKGTTPEAMTKTIIQGLELLHKRERSRNDAR